MSLLELASLGLALGTDSFSVSVGIGMNQLSRSMILQLSLLFSLMQVVLFAGGTNIHALVDGIIELLGHLSPTAIVGLSVEIVSMWLNTFFSLAGAALLAGLGINMLYGAWREEENAAPVYYSGRWGWFLLAFSVSVDALTAGVGVGMFTRVHFLPVLLTTGVVIWLMAFVGLTLGRQINRWIGRKAELVGGALLLILAVHLVSSSGIFW